ncbi:MAG: dihydrofolate reductase family protein [Microthrixaceae bacterium]|nr:dihydrofolate reductase family protein [Microthrixaceae bacterium]
MGHVSYGMLVSLDGFIAAPDGQITLPVPGPQLHRWFNAHQRDVALSVYGRRMWEVMRSWGEPDPDRDEIGAQFAREWVRTPKIVCSASMDASAAGAVLPDDVTLIGSDAVAALRRIKRETEGEIEVSGASLAASLGAAGLIDEFAMFTQPVVLGRGIPYFAAGFLPELRLISAEVLPDDVVLHRYAPR